MTTPDPAGYYRSLAGELLSQQSRVRDLIGDRHWLSDGRHKETLLASVLRRHLPTTVIVANGFALNPFLTDSCSREQDILIVDVTAEGPLFCQGELVIANPRQILAAVSVKSTLTSTTMGDALATLSSLYDVCLTANCESRPWYGAYFYGLNDACTTTPSRMYEYVKDSLAPIHAAKQSPFAASRFCPSAICSGGEHVFLRRLGEDDSQVQRLMGWAAAGIATAVFIADLVDHVAHCRGIPNAGITDALDGIALTAMDPAWLSIGRS